MYMHMYTLNSCYPTAFGNPATMLSPGCVCVSSCARCVCVCVYFHVSVCVCQILHKRYRYFLPEAG